MFVLGDDTTLITVAVASVVDTEGRRRCLRTTLAEAFLVEMSRAGVGGAT